MNDWLSALDTIKSILASLTRHAENTNKRLAAIERRLAALESEQQS